MRKNDLMEEVKESGGLVVILHTGEPVAWRGIAKILRREGYAPAMFRADLTSQDVERRERAGRVWHKIFAAMSSRKQFGHRPLLGHMISPDRCQRMEFSGHYYCRGSIQFVPRLRLGKRQR